jgi:hypothetical protein
MRKVILTLSCAPNVFVLCRTKEMQLSRPFWPDRLHSNVHLHCDHLLFCVPVGLEKFVVGSNEMTLKF